MKIMNLIKIVPACLMVLSLTVTTRGDNQMKPVDSIKIESIISTSDYPVVKILSRSTSSMACQDFVDYEDSELERWMFYVDYLDFSGTELALETWMTDGNYLNEEVSAIEGWMLDPDYLYSVGECSLEPWMLDAGYLSN